VAVRRTNKQWTFDEKSKWLAELARAIDEAQQLLWHVAAACGDDFRRSDLYGRLEAAGDEVQRLRRATDRQARLAAADGDEQDRRSSDDRHVRQAVERDWSDPFAGVAACAGALD
jgi:hypothetical protein